MPILKSRAYVAQLKIGCYGLKMVGWKIIIKLSNVIYGHSPCMYDKIKHSAWVKFMYSSSKASNSTSVFALLKHHSTSWGGQYNYANFQCGLAPRIYWYVFICFMNSFIKNEIDYLVVCNLSRWLNWIHISITLFSGNPLCMWNSWNSLINLLQSCA